MAKQTIQLCTASEFPEIGVKGFSLSDNETQQDIFVIRQNNQWQAYQNSCPHLGLPLNWQTDQFFDDKKAYIQCAVHGALFRIKDGLCIWGPCIHQSLSPILVRLVDGNVVLDRDKP